MSNPISNEMQNRPLPTETRRRGAHSSNADQQPATGTGKGRSSTDIDRAAQRLAQQTAQAPASTIADAETARERVNELKSQLQQSPQTGAAAYRGVTQEGFEAAIARPTA